MASSCFHLGLSLEQSRSGLCDFSRINADLCRSSEQIICVTIELPAAPPSQTHVSVGGLVPWTSTHDSVFHLLEVRRSFDRVCQGGQEDIGPAIPHVRCCRFDILDLLAFVAPHKEHASGNPSRSKRSDCCLHALDADSAFHLVQ